MAQQSKRQNGVLWLDKTGLSLYVENRPFIRLNFTPDIISHLEVMDNVKLENAVHAFLNQYKLSNLYLIMILNSDILFEKDWQVPQNDLQQKEEVEFTDSLPFENVIVHAWTKDNKKKLIATNRDFITDFKSILEKDDCHIIAVFPYSVFSANIRNESVKEIWKKMDNLKHDNLIEVTHAQPTTTKIGTENPDQKKETSILPIVIPIFVILIGVLAYLLLKK